MIYEHKHIKFPISIGPFAVLHAGHTAHHVTYSFWCPGCESEHSIYVPNRSRSDEMIYDLVPDRPTYLRTLDSFYPTFCSLHVSNGYLAYSAKSEHRYAGKTIPMVKYSK